MKKLLVALATVALAACQSMPSGSDENVPGAVRAVIAAQEAAWNRGDLEGFFRGYWRSPKLVFFSVDGRTEGWEAMLERFRRSYRAEGKEMGRLSFSGLDIQALSPGAAFVRGTWRLDFEKREPRQIGGLFTLIFRRMPEGWLIVHDHTSASGS